MNPNDKNIDVSVHEGTFSIEDAKKNPNAIVLDSDMAPELPDVPKLLKTVIEILEYMKTDEVSAMKEEDFGDYSNHMETKWPEFADRYYSVFQKVISGEDITMLLRMFAMLENVGRGHMSLESAERQLGEELAQQYIYPKVREADARQNKKNGNKK